MTDGPAAVTGPAPANRGSCRRRSGPTRAQRASAVIITGMHRNSVPIPPGFSTADHTDTDYAPLFRRLVGHLHGSRIPSEVGGVDIRPGADASYSGLESAPATGRLASRAAHERELLCGEGAFRGRAGRGPAGVHRRIMLAGGVVGPQCRHSGQWPSSRLRREAIRSRHRRRSSTPSRDMLIGTTQPRHLSPGDTRSAAVGSSSYTPPRRAAPTHPDRRRHRPQGCKSASSDCTGPVPCRFRCTGRRPDLGIVFAVVLTSVIAQDASPRPRRGSAGPDAHRGTPAVVTGHAVPGRTPRGPPRLRIVECADV